MTDTEDTSRSEDRDMQILKSHVAQLAEHFDTVQILVTRHDPSQGGTISATWGEGNWYARIGQTKNWVVQQEATAAPEATSD